MKRIFIIVILLLPFRKSIGQLSGTVKDSATGHPLAFVTIQLSKDSSTLVTSTFSDSSGFYRFPEIPAGRYFLSFSRTGYTMAVGPLFSVSPGSPIHAPEQLLAPTAKQLSRVTVFSRKPLVERSADGVIYNVQEDLLAGGGTAVDVLRKTPLVTVGPDGNPAIRGSSNIRVFIDDRPSDVYAASIAEALQQIPAEQIVKVEVILYPSAKYDAEGTDGVINITTRRKTVNGASGTVSLNLGNLNPNITASVNIRSRQWIFNVEAGDHFFRSRNGSRTSRVEIDKSRLLQENEWLNKGNIFFSGFNVIYEPDSLKTIYGGYRLRINSLTNSPVVFNNYFVGDSLVTSFQRNTFTRTGNEVQTVNAGYNAKSKNQKSEWKLFAVYFRHLGHNNYNLEQFRKQAADYRENFYSETRNAEISVQADYAQKISATFRLEAGIKSVNRQSESTNQFEVFQQASGKFIEDHVRANDFGYDRDVYAAYTNAIMTRGSWQLRMGGRYEQTILRAEFKDTLLGIPDYKNFIPSILLTKNIDTKHSIKLSYNKQILRPYLSYLNPATNYADSLNQEYGNPYLLPEVTRRYDIGYTGNFKKIFAGATIFYSRNHNSIENIRTPANDGVFKSTYLNIGKKDAAGLSANLSYKGSRLTVNTTMTVRYMMLNSAALQLKNNGIQFNGSLNLSWKFEHGYSIEAVSYINSRDIRLQGSREGWRFYSLRLNKKTKNEKGTITLRAETYNRYITEDFETTAFHQRTETRYQNLFIVAGFSWKFGKKEIKVPVTQQESSE